MTSKKKHPAGGHTHGTPPCPGGRESAATLADTPGHVYLPLTSRAAAGLGREKGKKDSQQTRDNLAFQLQQEKYQSEDLKDAIKKVRN